MASTSVGQIVLPQASLLVGSGVAGIPVTGNAPTSGQVPISIYSDVNLGYKRLLKNIACSVFNAITYSTGTAGATSGGGSPTHMLPQFNMYKNGKLVFTSSAQIELVVANVGAQIFQNVAQYGIYTDFVNPIEVYNSDSLSIEVVAYGFEIFTDNPNANPTTSNPWAASQVIMQVNPNGVITYSEEER